MSAKRILIVDDRADNLYLLRALLEGNGFEVDTAGNGVEALAAAHAHLPDLIISDILMPVMDGFALCREWKHDERLKSVPFIFYTATYTDDQDRLFALSLGADRFVEKPAEPDAFMRVIQDALTAVSVVPGADETPAGMTSVEPLEQDDREYLQRYNATLVRKLEAKMQQLEIANRELAQDVEMRWAAEEALRASEERYRGYVDNAPYGVFVADETGHYVEANRAAAELTGYSDAELVGLSITRLLAPESVEWGVREFARLAVDGSITGVATFLRKDGTRFVGRLDAVRLSDTRFLGFLVDVTEQQQAQEQMLRQAALIDLAHDAILVVGLDRRILFWSRGAEQTYGWTRAEAIGSPAEELLRTTFPEPLESVMATLEATGEWEGELEHATKTGLRRTVASRWSLKRDADGAPEQVLEINRDITAQVKAVADLAESAEGLRRALTGVVTALGAIVELRDPYTSGHQHRVAELACAIATELGWTQTSIDLLRMAALLHDVGKVVVPAEILTKPGRLTPIEMRLIHEHSAAGADTVAVIDFGGDVADVIRQHHERLDGSGYPNGTKGDAILPAARVLSVADVVEAMASHRPYRAALPLEVALDEIRSGAGVVYDADVVAACVAVFEKGFAFEA